MWRLFKRTVRGEAGGCRGGGGESVRLSYKEQR